MFTKKSKDKISVYIKSTFGVKTKNIKLWQQAFTHKSISRENNNERLEFVGDAVLSAIITSFLYKKYPTKNEGELSKLTSKIVNRKHLNKLGKEIGLTPYIKVVKHPDGNKNIVGNTFEAVVGALYLDLGYKPTQKAILKIIKKHVSIKEIDNANEDYKSQLLIWSQKNQKKIEFTYKKHYKSELFEVTLKIDKKKIVSAKAPSKKKAENEVAKKAMEMFPTITSK